MTVLWDELKDMIPDGRLADERAMGFDGDLIDAGNMQPLLTEVETMRFGARYTATPLATRLLTGASLRNYRAGREPP